tara:strand:- start:51346 stop:52446 length:1101 start_codon:yes stop_codon:yes gene_type:complete
LGWLAYRLKPNNQWRAELMSLLNTALFADPELDELMSDTAHLAAMVRFESMLAQASAAEGLVPAEAATAIVDALSRARLDMATLASGLAQDGVAVPALVRELRATLSEAYRPYLHYGATSQDVIDTAWMLQMAQIVPLLQGRMSRVGDALDGLKAQFGSQQVMAHTRMQAALPIALDDKIAGWRRAIDECAAGLTFAADRALAVQLGGPVGDRASFEGKGDAIAARLAVAGGLRDVRAWHGNRVALCRMGAELAGISGVLGKIGADIAQMSQSEVVQARIRGGGKSSAMAHKNNPIAAELLVALARHSAGNLGTLYQALVHENERSGAAWTLEWLTMPTLVRDAGCGLLIAMDLLQKLDFPPQDIS